jgi:hypothetical protein
VSSDSRVRAISITRCSDSKLTPSYRCRQELGKVIGLEPQGQCVGSDPSQLDLGTFIENGDKGCVLWNMWAVQTTG